MARREALLVGLDVGAAKVAVVVGKSNGEDLAVLSCGFLPLGTFGSAPLLAAQRRGTVVDLKATTEAIVKAVHEAELGANCGIHSVLASMGGAHVRSVNSHGVVAIKRGEVRPEDVERVLEAARALALPDDRQVLHVLPQDYVLDGQEGILDATGMSGIRLEARVHVVTASVAAAQNVLACCQGAGLGVVGLVWAPLATAEAVLTQEEKELGVALLDFGAGTTDVLVFDRGALRFSFSLGIGGAVVTSDVAHGLQTPFHEAEHLKVSQGCAVRDLVGAQERVEVPGVGGRPPRLVPRSELAWMIEARVEEIVQLVWEEVRKVEADRYLNCGIVLAGGGASLPGLDVLVQRVTGHQVRVVKDLVLASDDQSQDPPTVLDGVYAGALGLLRFHLRSRGEELVPQTSAHRVFHVVKSYLREFVSALRA